MFWCGSILTDFTWKNKNKNAAVFWSGSKNIFVYNLWYSYTVSSPHQTII